MTEYTTLDSREIDGVRVGDRVTFTSRWSGPHPVTSIVTEAHAGLEGGTVSQVKVAGWWLMNTDDEGPTIHLVERPVPEVVEVIGAVYGVPGRSYLRVACVDPGDDQPWLTERLTVSRLEDHDPDDQWVTPDEVRTLVREHGYVRLDSQEDER